MLEPAHLIALAQNAIAGNKVRTGAFQVQQNVSKM